MIKVKRFDSEREMRIFVEQCDKETMLQREYTYSCMIDRNKYIVDNSSVLIAVYDGTCEDFRHTLASY